MSPMHKILDAVREFWLSCIGAPQARSRQLAALRRLDAHLLKDIGLTPDEARRGAAYGSSPERDAGRPRAGIRIPGAYPNR